MDSILLFVLNVICMLRISVQKKNHFKSKAACRAFHLSLVGIVGTSLIST